MGEDDGKSIIENRVNLLLKGVSFVILSLLSHQGLTALALYYPDFRLSLIWLISLLGIIIGMIEANLFKKVNNWPYSLRLIFIGSLIGLLYLGLDFSYSVVSILNLSIVLVIYRISYKLTYLIEEITFDITTGTREGKNYESKLLLFKYIQQIIIIIDSLLVIFWLFRLNVKRSMILVGAVIFLLQFILLVIAHYQKKKIYWYVNHRKVHSKVFVRIISWMVLLSIFFSIPMLVLPVGYNLSVWPWLGDKVSNLFEEGKLIIHSKDFNDFANSVIKSHQIEGLVNRGGKKSSLYTWLFFIIILIFIILILTGGIVLTGLIIWEFVIKESGSFQFGLKKIKEVFCRVISWIKARKKLLVNRAKGIKTKEQTGVEKKIDKESTASQIAKDSETAQEEIMFLFFRIKKLFHEYGLYKKDTQTIGEYLEIVRHELSSTTPQIMQIRRLLEEALYSSHNINKIHVSKMKAAVKTIEKIY